MEYTRLLRRGMSGADVRYMKDALLRLGYLNKSTHDSFGDDTFAAVKAFQRSNRDLSGKRLIVDGVIGERTWAAITRALSAEPGEPGNPEEIPPNIGTGAAEAISAALTGVSKERKRIVLLALSFAYDPAAARDYPYSLYIRGGNLYNTDLALNVIDSQRIESGAKRQPEYYNAGSRQMMLAAVKKHPETTGADCSGGIVGLLRKLGFVKRTFDRTANQLCSVSYAVPIERSALRAGDFVGRPGHIGLYAGGGYVVEWAGKLYGCQLTRFDNRRAYDFVGRRLRKLSAWTKFCDPTFY